MSEYTELMSELSDSDAPRRISYVRSVAGPGSLGRFRPYRDVGSALPRNRRLPL